MHQLESWEYDVLEIYNLLRRGPLDPWFDFLRSVAPDLEGDVLEAGVWKGRSLISAGILLKDSAPKKTIYGYDTFSGFPSSNNPIDDPKMFDKLMKDNQITEEHYARIQRNLEHIEFKVGTTVTKDNISSSGNFSGTSKKNLENKLKYLNLQNIKLVDGPFNMTMKNNFHGKLSAVLLDCDLYDSYFDVFKFTWNSLSIGGMMYLDEYYSLKFPGARIATNQFLNSIENSAELNYIADEFNGFERWWLIKKKSFLI